MFDQEAPWWATLCHSGGAAFCQLWKKLVQFIRGISPVGFPNLCLFKLVDADPCEITAVTPSGVGQV
jgi:hypothetical protein